jgi:molecular chaperone Hsp33
MRVEEQDTLRRFIFEHAPIRGEIVRLGATWRAVTERCDYPLPIRNLLGEMMAACALLSATLKYQGRLVMQMQGGGPIQLLVVECTDALTLRAMAKWSSVPHSGALSEMLGSGKFVVTIEPAEGRQSYQGIVELEGNSIASALESYMLRSEQLETRLWLAADAHCASGLLLQLLPQPTKDDADIWPRAVHLASTIMPSELLELPARLIIRRLYHEEDIRLFNGLPCSFRCSCSRERVAAMLRILGHDEVQSILQGRRVIEVDCEFCNRHYVFDPVDAEQLFASDWMSLPHSTKH